MLSAIGSPLVAGGMASTNMETRYIKVIRPFFHKREVQPAGAVIEVPKHVAAEVIASGKASAADKPAPAVKADPPPPAKTEPVAAPAPKKRGKDDAR